MGRVTIPALAITNPLTQIEDTDLFVIEQAGGTNAGQVSTLKEYINADSGTGIPTGGTEGQVLTKNSSTDFDVSWDTVNGLPPQTGNAQDSLITDGTNAKWGTGLTSKVSNWLMSQFPQDVAGLIADFDFGSYKSLTFGTFPAIASITDDIGGVVSSASGALQPTYNAYGGPANRGYANFNGSQYLIGNLLSSSTTFTMVVVRRTNGNGSTALSVPFQNGVNGTGYAIADYYDGSVTLSGAYFDGNTGNASIDFYQWTNRWEIIVYSHSPGINKCYNSAGTFITPGAATANPVTPTTYHYIGTGYINGNGYCTLNGDIARCLLFNTQLTDLDVKKVCNYLSNQLQITLPLNLIFGGDSKMAGVSIGANNQIPEQVLLGGLQPNYYTQIKNGGISGRTTYDLLGNLPDEVLTYYNPLANNIYAFMIGNNDTDSTTNIINRIKQIGQNALAAGYKVIWMTDLYSTNPTHNTNTDTINNALKAELSSFCTALCDSNQIPEASAVNMANPLYSYDGTHPTALLDSYIANLIRPIIEGLI